MKILIIDDDSHQIQIAFLRMICEKMGISVEVIEEKKSLGKDISEIIQELSLLKPPSISILEIPAFLEEPEAKRKKTIFWRELKIDKLRPST